MRIPNFLFNFYIFTIVLATSSSNSSFLSDDEDFLENLEASGDEAIDEKIVFSTMVEDTTLTSSTEFDDQLSASSEIIEFYDSSDYTVTSKISIFDPELKQANEEVKNLQEEITELIEETIEEQNKEPIEKLKQEIIEERNRENMNFVIFRADNQVKINWIAMASIIVGFLLICSAFALLIHRYQQKDRGSYEIMTPFEYQKGNREAFA